MDWRQQNLGLLKLTLECVGLFPSVDTRVAALAGCSELIQLILLPVGLECEGFLERTRVRREGLDLRRLLGAGSQPRLSFP